MPAPTTTVADPLPLISPSVPMPAEHPMAWLTSAVPAAVAAVAGWTPQRRVDEADGYADTIASGADVLWADPRSAGSTEVGVDEVRHAIAHGLAILAHRPDGVSFGGLHWHAASGCRTCPGPGGWTLPPSSTDRETRGAYFTPRALADEIAGNAIGPFLVDGCHEDIASLRVADIACGSGAFLVAAARRIAAALLEVWTDGDRAYFTREYRAPDAPAAARAIAIDCVHGVDIDPASVELARLALRLLAPSDQLIDLKIRAGDALLGLGHPARKPPASFPPAASRFDWPSEFPEVFRSPHDVACGFDVVIGNPPYLGGNKLSSALGAAYREHLATAIAHGRRGPVDLAVYFWLRAHELVCDHGTVGVIGPAGLDRGANLRAWRDHLTRRGWRTYRTEPVRRWPSRSAAVGCRILYTHFRRWIEPEFTDAGDDLDQLPHTCDFTTDPPRYAETWRPRSGCARCQRLSGQGSQLLRTQLDGQAYELVRHPPAPDPAPVRPPRDDAARGGQLALFPP
ncbi:DNA methyltransferase [Micromonospora sp. NPDC049662]|uniref:Eco57I restriction-modification methylase domain-containing protein n=1 Tax=Micromonospora sp. NPDC049662 TaxID=3155397 RepID=UPI00342429BE